MNEMDQLRQEAETLKNAIRVSTKHASLITTLLNYEVEVHIMMIMIRNWGTVAVLQ